MILLEIILIFGALGLMGKAGKLLFDFNFELFGIFSYAYPPILIHLSYLYYKKKKIDARYIELSLAYIFLFLILLILQASSLGFGLFGKAVIGFLHPYLGSFGIWILCIFWISVCLLSLSNKDIIELFKKIDFSKFLAFVKSSLKQIKDSKLLKQIPKHLKNKLKIRLKPFPPSITESPSIELQIKPTPLLTNSRDLHKPDQAIPQNKEITEDFMFKNGKIEIQEFIITPEKNEKKADIRIVDSCTPPKENPFLKDHFSKEIQNISTSAELLKKIKNQNSPTPKKQTLKPPSATPCTKQDLNPSALNFQSPKNAPPNPIPPHAKTTQTIESNLDSMEWENDFADASLEEKIQKQNQAHLIDKLPIPQPIESPPSRTTSLSKSKTTHIKSLEENEALLKEIEQGEIELPRNYELPPIALLSPAPKYENEIDENEIDSKIQSLLAKLSVFKIDGDVIRTYSGPIITTFEFRPAPNVKVSRIQSLESDIAMALEAKSIRIQAPIPGKNVVGIEIPNSNSQTIYLREIFESEIFQNSTSPLTLALGKDVVGNPFITDLKKLPHLLIAGTTGSGKSVGVNAMILSLLYRNSPDDLKLMMVDPKMVEFMPYSDLPHLITPIITDPKKAIIGLSNAVREMERRYMLMSQTRTKEIISYNQKAEELGFEKFPYFVIIIDELADLMMTAGKEVEYSMARIAQMGRASGMHLIVATQSPRAEVLTGLIKTNLPAHLSYKVGTKIDASIIGCAGAETLLGRGDMLFTPPGTSGLVRLHAPWSSEEEISEIIAYIKSQREVAYDASFLPEEKETFGAMDCENFDEETTLLLSQAKQIILQNGKTSISYLQRRLSIGYNKAADLIEKLEQLGFLSEADSKGNRKIL